MLLEVKTCAVDIQRRKNGKKKRKRNLRKKIGKNPQHKTPWIFLTFKEPVVEVKERDVGGRERSRERRMGFSKQVGKESYH